MFSLIVDDVGHVDYFAVIMRFKAAKVQIIIKKLILFMQNAILDAFNFLILFI